jgi:hypothetical protein
VKNSSVTFIAPIIIFLRASWMSSFLKNFITANQRKTPFKDNMPGDEWF